MFSASSCSFGFIPAISGLLYFAWTISFKDATRTIKNSSRLDAVMLKNFSRSNRGIFTSFASLSTRRLNITQLNSLFV